MRAGRRSSFRLCVTSKSVQTLSGKNGQDSCRRQSVLLLGNDRKQIRAWVLDVGAFDDAFVAMITIFRSRARPKRDAFVMGCSFRTTVFCARGVAELSPAADEPVFKITLPIQPVPLLKVVCEWLQKHVTQDLRKFYRL